MKPVRLLRIAVVVQSVLSFAVRGVVGAESGDAVRAPCCAGTWYPGEASALGTYIDDLLAKAKMPEVTGRPLAVIAPHAGYRFSAPAAAGAYRCLQGQTYRRVIVLAFSHRHAAAYQGVDVPRDLNAYETPLGKVPVDRAVCEQLLKKRLFAAHPGVDREEHSLELQLPFLQRVLKSFELVPVLVGRMYPQDYVAVAETLLDHIDADTLLVASSDFTHFGPNYGYQPFSKNVPEELRELADKAAGPIVNCDVDGFTAHLNATDDTICGRGPITLLMRVLSMQNPAEAVRTAFDTSGQMTGDWTNSVTYQSFVFVPRRGTLDAAQRGELLKLARRTVTEFLKTKKPPEIKVNDFPPALRADGACFVTLENKGELRGCIGNMVATGPLCEAVVHNAVSACQDYRFVGNPVTSGEVDQLHIEISYLTPMKRIKKIDEIIVGRHGLLIGMGQHRGVLLPQVAARRGWSRTEFLDQTCRKAGLQAGTWKQPSAEIYSFEAEVFGEPAPSK